MLWGVALGLLVGKPVGTTLMAWACVRLGLVTLPEGTDFRQLAGIGLLGGIGFTVALFITDLAFVDPPFAAGLWEQVVPLVAARLKPDGWLYVEAPHEAAFALPAEWRLHREGRTREVRYALYRRAA